MVPAQFAALGRLLETAMRLLNERGELCRQMAKRFRSADDPAPGTLWEAAMQEAKERTVVLRRLLEGEWTHPDSMDPPHPAIG
jgi:hypothetical protein